MPIVAAFIENSRGKRLTIPQMVQQGADGGLQYVEKYNDGAVAFLLSLTKGPIRIGATLDGSGGELSYDIAKTLSASDQRHLRTCLDDFRNYLIR